MSTKVNIRAVLVRARDVVRANRDVFLECHSVGASCKLEDIKAISERKYYDKLAKLVDDLNAAIRQL